MDWLIMVLAIIVVGVVLVLGFGYWNFNRKIRGDVNRLFSEAAKANKTIVTEAMLKGLPEPVQRYLRYTGVVGKPMVNSVRLTQLGKMRRTPQQPWLPIEAKQYYTVNPPGFVWNATMRTAGLPVVRGEDQYYQGKGAMHIKMGALLNIVNARGEKLDQGAMMRYLSEMIWFPAAFLGDNITWKAIDDCSAEVTLTDQGKQVSGTLYVDDQGKMTNFMARRYAMLNDTFTLETWSTPMTAYGEFEGLKLPSQGKAVWKLKDGDLEYIDVEITGIEYDVPKVY